MDAAPPLRYLSVCSGIEAATVAWHPLGFEAAGFSEIDPFARAMLSDHYPDVPLHGDFTTLMENDYGAIDLLVGGTPCQSFSIAGLRKGFTDDRGNLALGFIRLAQSAKPRWVVWENVPGVLSIDGGRTFGTFLGALAECGYGFAYRILDAQYFGVPQRRRRVFVIGYLGDWRPAAAVLFERESLQRDITPSRQTQQEVAGTFKSRASSGGWGADVDLASSGYMRPVAGTLGARTCLSRGAQDADCGHLIARTLMGASAKHDAELETYVVDKQQWPADVACTLNAQYGDKMGLEDQHALAGAPLFVPARAYNVTYCDANGRRKDRPNGGMYVSETDQSKTVTAGGDRSTYIAFEPGSIARNAGPRHLTETCSTLRADMGDNQPAILYPLDLRNALRDPDKMDDVNRQGCGIGENGAPSPTLSAAYTPGVISPMAVRRLTPRECERLQGFPDDYTLIPYRGKPAADGPRYKALGNSMAVPVMRWLGQRIQQVNNSQTIAGRLPADDRNLRMMPHP
ncbi:MAG: DNA (cytosine-5-)-methyltransferase [Rickettsiales bacterium]|nr:DNA (cytosine-5-)-methyltransferase [Rickettsiales bacterium]